MSVKVKPKKTKREINNLTVLSLSVFISFLVFVFMLAVFSVIVMKNHTENSLLQVYVIISSGVSTLFAGLICSYSVKTKRLIYGMFSGIFVVICQFLILLCFNNVSMSWHIYFLIPVAIITSFSGCLAGINIKK